MLCFVLLCALGALVASLLLLQLLLVPARSEVPNFSSKAGWN